MGLFSALTLPEGRRIRMMIFTAMNIENFSELTGYLTQNLLLERSSIADYAILTGGVSNKAVMVSVSGRSKFVVKQALARLRVENEWISDPQRVLVEARALGLIGQYVPRDSFPTLIHADPEYNIIVISAIEEPHVNWKTHLMSGVVDKEVVERSSNWLAALHMNSGADPLVEGKVGGPTFFESLRLDPYYAVSARTEPRARIFLTRLSALTLSRKLCLVHGDFSPKNILVGPGRFAVLDYEVMHYGDPAFDLGFMMTHFLSKARYHFPKQDAFLEAAHLFWETYSTAMDPDRAMHEYCTQHLLACLLARVCGSSPLEYLSAEQGSAQREFCLQRIGDPPQSMDQLIEEYAKTLNDDHHGRIGN